MNPNRLIHETSPYLLQHAYNPVDWRPWSKESLQYAIDSNKPILLSVGYSACHWCHVMAHESFENQTIAQFMNEHFVNIKVDREERPDVDHLYMTFVQLTTGQGGWPMTVFMTPEGKPFFGGTYFPPEYRFGKPGFLRVLKFVADLWDNNRSQIEAATQEIFERLRHEMEPSLSSDSSLEDLPERGFQQFHKSYDAKNGGFGAAPKFPCPIQIEFLFHHALTTKSDIPLDMALHTLDQMAMGGMYDHIGGGFHRYSTDAYWLVPHFEKMLYDNAQLSLIYLKGWRITGGVEYRLVAEEILDYILREMTSPEGAFYSSQDADSSEGEGVFYTWKKETLDRLLPGRDGELFCRFYDVTGNGNWEGRNILNQVNSLCDFAANNDIPLSEFLTWLRDVKQRLRLYRGKSSQPPIDDKIIVAWNALMMKSFVEAGVALKRADYLDAAIKNAQFLLENLSKLEDGEASSPKRLLRRTGRFTYGKSDERRFHGTEIEGFLEDYAFLCDSLLSLYCATGNAQWLEVISQLVDTVLQDFSHSESGFYSTSLRTGEELIQRPFELMDGATPAPNAVFCRVLAQLPSVQPDCAPYEDRVEKIIQHNADAFKAHPSAYPSFLSLLEYISGTRRDIRITGNQNTHEFEELLNIAMEGYDPFRIVHRSQDSDKAVAPNEPGELSNSAKAYYCEAGVCYPPIADPQELKKKIEGFILSRKVKI
jgi:uncharacterized protein YyaL (SSP411 family)